MGVSHEEKNRMLKEGVKQKLSNMASSVHRLKPLNPEPGTDPFRYKKKEENWEALRYGMPPRFY